MSDVEKDIRYTRRSLELAAEGIGLVSPNPLVGCVIVSPNGDVVGEGTYIYDDVAHAEQIALEQAGERARGGTAYVSLEPHHHQGRTPPCTEALINAGITRVVCPIEDPNPLVSGTGFARLREAGVEVLTGLLADEAAIQNEKFICWHKKRRPFVHVKLALSLDGRISTGRNVRTPLSSAAALQRTHELRHEYDAILIGGNTALVDDPILTDRSGKRRRRPLVRIVLDNRLRLEISSRVVDTAQQAPTIIFSNSENKTKKTEFRGRGVDVIDMDARDIGAVLGELWSREIQSVLVEGGSSVAGSFFDAGLVDKISFMYAPLVIGGADAPVSIAGKATPANQRAVPVQHVKVTRHENDIEVTGYPSTSDAP